MKSILALSLFSMIGAFAQSGDVGIGTTTPAASAALDITSTTKGLLTPRMTEAQRNAITTPANGLLVYQTDATPGFYFYDGTTWKPFNNSSWTDALTFNPATSSSERIYYKGLTDVINLNPVSYSKGLRSQLQIDGTAGYAAAAMGSSVFAGYGPVSGGTPDQFERKAWTGVEPLLIGYQIEGDNYTTNYSGRIDELIGISTQIGFWAQDNNTIVRKSIAYEGLSIAKGVSDNTLHTATGARLNVLATGGNVGGDAIGLEIIGVNSNTTGANRSFGIKIDNNIVATNGSSNNAWSIFNSSSSPSYFAGTIGIGTIAPEQMLHLYKNDAASYPAMLLDNGAAGGNKWGIASIGDGFGTDSNQLGFGNFTTGLWTMVIKNNGNLGLGTSEPGAKLDVIGSTSFPIASRFIATGNGTSDNYGVIGMATTTTTGRNIGVWGFAGNGSNNYGIWSSGNTALNGKVYLQQPGDDLNTTTPVYGFGVSGAQTNYGAWATHAFYNGGKTIPTMIIDGINGDSKVGIGTAAPEQMLHIYKNDAASYPGMVIQNGASGGKSWSLIATGDGWTTNSNQFAIGIQNEGWHFAIKNNGNVGIGWTNPNAKLDVNGYIKVGSSDGTADSALTAGLIRFNSGTGKFQGYDGTTWVDLN